MKLHFTVYHRTFLFFSFFSYFIYCDFYWAHTASQFLSLTMSSPIAERCSRGGALSRGLLTEIQRRATPAISVVRGVKSLIILCARVHARTRFFSSFRQLNVLFSLLALPPRPILGARLRLRLRETMPLLPANA